MPGAIPAKGVPPFPYNTYDLFEITEKTASQFEAIQPNRKTTYFVMVSRILGIYAADSSIQPHLYDHVLQFPVELGPKEKKSIRLMVTSSARGLTADELEELRAMDFASALEQRVLDLEGIIEKGTQIQVPDANVNNHLQSSNTALPDPVAAGRGPRIIAFPRRASRGCGPGKP